LPDHVWESDPELSAEAEAEIERHRVARLDVADARPPEYSDEALALRFSAKYADSARYVADWGRWLLWDGAVWNFDHTMRAFDFSRTICRIASAELPAKQKKLAAAVASSKTVAATIGLARADRRHAMAVDQWDTDPMLLITRKRQDGC
jgi:putative DNA primase/helicase